MKKYAHAHSALIQSKQFRGRIARKECAHFNEVGRNAIFYNMCVISDVFLPNFSKFSGKLW